MIKIAYHTILLCFAMQNAIAQPPLFELLSPKQTNIKFENHINETENLNVLAYEYFYNGGGVAVGDIDNDGLEDLFLVSNMGESKLFKNTGHLRFKDITKEAGTELAGRAGGWKTGVTMADVNGDGWLDIYVCYSGKVSDDARRNQLFINQSNGTFKEEAAAYGIGDKSYSTQAAFFDYDNDGDLDLFLLNHSVKKIDNMELARYRDEVDELAGNKLYENIHNHFVDVSKKAGIRQNPLTFGLGIAIADINKDGWQDVYVTNDYNEPDYMYINNGNGTFTNKADVSLRYLSQFSMGVDIADLNNDALPDIITLDMLPEDNRRQKLLQLQENYESFALMVNQGLNPQYMRNMLQLNNGVIASSPHEISFSEIGQLAGVSNTDWSWCPLLADYDNDGFKDLFITNGYFRDYTNKDFLRYWGDYKVKKAVDREPVLLMDLIRAMPSTSIVNYIFRNNHNCTFSNQQKLWGMDKPAVSSGAVYADLDNDGDLDLVVNNINENTFVYRNTAREHSKAGYLSLVLHYKKPNWFAIGTKVYVYDRHGIQYEELNPARGYLSCVTTRLHFGLDSTNIIDSIKIVWPDHATQVLTNVTANQQLTINYEQPKPVIEEDPVYAGKTIFTPTDKLFTYTHTDASENDFKRQLLMLFMYSKCGPVMAKGDINRDGLEDLFVSGDKNKPGKIYVQNARGSFYEAPDCYIGDENASTISAAAFVDVNGDGSSDLYIAKGGYALYEPGSPALQDELYINDGRGQFKKAAGTLPDVSACSKSCVRPCDFDGDGDMDLFVGGRIIPGRYPVAPTSFLLVNDGRGHFTAATIPFSNIGMVTDAQWVDLDKDGRKDLVLCGEFMPVTVFMNTPTGFVDKTSIYFDKPTNGFWFTLQIADLDQDGYDDIIAGNLGLNHCIHVSEKEPGELYYADFDGNGSIDPFFNFYIQGQSYPFVSRDELNEQIYPMRKKFTSYAAYSTVTINDIFTKEELERAGRLRVTETRTMAFLNRNKKLVPVELPMQTQFSVVTCIIADDFNGDGKKDLLLLGNHSDNRLKIGCIDASYGCLLTGDGKGNFTYINQTQSGLDIKGDVKAAMELKTRDTKYILAGVCNNAMQFYKVQ
ncbi:MULTISPECIES: VCBS repeat-containing protein [Niastella]|uniref:VCBS repeat-containing protein n=1 Tax=Niastella soli TaxID=2821487 RepID=A0ABS3YSY8_9BACT|nr:VCBS repeat-containing protein [Niastella soli]MBO9200697.1 VCBS repeat-containing protein [Niastella soli]